LVVLVCVGGSLAGTWAASRLLGFEMNASVVASLSGVLSSALLARELQGKRKSPVRSAS
jgi:hypothetical protein